MANQRNGEIDIFRFVFATIIVFMHFGLGFPKINLFPSGRIGVEFYFIVTGYLMAYSSEKRL